MVDSGQYCIYGLKFFPSMKNKIRYSSLRHEIGVILQNGIFTFGHVVVDTNISLTEGEFVLSNIEQREFETDSAENVENSLITTKFGVKRAFR